MSFIEKHGCISKVSGNVCEWDWPRGPSLGGLALRSGRGVWTYKRQTCHMYGQTFYRTLSLWRERMRARDREREGEREMSHSRQFHQLQLRQKSNVPLPVWTRYNGYQAGNVQPKNQRENSMEGQLTYLDLIIMFSTPYWTRFNFYTMHENINDPNILNIGREY